MKESIYTIPISEAFEVKDGCPLCQIHKTLERRWVEYITGAAMMEPDVREKTNEFGFCGDHYSQMLEQKNRLAVALILQTHLATLGEKLKSHKFGGKHEHATETCFVCDRIDAEFARILENIAVVWSREGDFKELYIHQEYVCLNHCKKILHVAQKKLRGRDYAEFAPITRELAAKRLFSLKADVDAFCKLYDYRSVGGEPAPLEVTSSIERAISFLVCE